MKARRLVPRVAWCFVIGAMATLAACWLPGAIINTGQYQHIRAGGKFSNIQSVEMPVRVQLMRGLGWDVFSVSRLGNRSIWPPGPLPTGNEPDLNAVITRPIRRVVWPAMKARVESTPRAYSYQMELRGWPARGLWWANDFFGWPSHPFEGAIALGGTHATFHWTDMVPRALPYRPIWSGLAINLAFWSAAAAPFVFAPALMRRLRHRPGTCPACRYDLRGLPAGSPCPECGVAPASR